MRGDGESYRRTVAACADAKHGACRRELTRITRSDCPGRPGTGRGVRASAAAGREPARGEARERALATHDRDEAAARARVAVLARRARGAIGAAAAVGEPDRE